MRNLLAIALAMLPAAAMAEVADQSAAGFQVRHVVEIDAPPSRVRAAVLDVGQWWSSSHTYSGRAANLTIDVVAGCFCETLPEGQVRHMTVTYSDANALRLFGGLGPLQTTGAAGHLAFVFKPATDTARTLLTVTYDVGGYARGGLAETWARPVDAVIGEQVGRLKKLIETGKPN